MRSVFKVIVNSKVSSKKSKIIKNRITCNNQNIKVLNI